MWFVGQVPGCGQHVARLVVVGEVADRVPGPSSRDIRLAADKSWEWSQFLPRHRESGSPRRDPHSITAGE